MTDLSDYYSAGYFLIRAGKPDWPQLQNDLLPEKLVSVSNCICSKVTLSWAWHPSKQETVDFGIPEEKFDEFAAWCSDAHQKEIEVWGMFHSTDFVQRFIQQFLSDMSDLYIIGVGLHREITENHWLSEDSTEGVTKRLKQHLPIEAGGNNLGFEVVAYVYHDFCDTWLCSGLDQEMHQLFGIQPIEHGLIGSYEDAKKVYEWIAEDEMKGTRAEPLPYYPWLLVSYPLEL